MLALVALVVVVWLAIVFAVDTRRQEARIPARSRNVEDELSQ